MRPLNCVGVCAVPAETLDRERAGQGAPGEWRGVCMRVIGCVCIRVRGRGTGGENLQVGSLRVQLHARAGSNAVCHALTGGDGGAADGAVSAAPASVHPSIHYHPVPDIGVRSPCGSPTAAAHRHHAGLAHLPQQHHPNVADVADAAGQGRAIAHGGSGQVQATHMVLSERDCPLA